MNQYNQPPKTYIAEQSKDTLQRIRDSEYSVLIGKNNCGKSYLLKSLALQWGPNASFLGPARYQNFNLLGSYTPNQNRLSDRWQQFTQQMDQQHQNIDNSPINLQQAIAELSNVQRDKLVDIMYVLLGVKMEIRHTMDGNSMSQKYISCDGHNISYTSSGFRLIATLVTSLLDTDYDTYLIDEPELGISPEAQCILSDFLFDKNHRQKYFSHIRTLVFATHSTMFLDRRNIFNNYTVQKSGDEILMNGISTLGELNKIHFFLLGNRFETLYLPSAIVLVEGKCDHRFIERVTSIRFPNAQLSIISANGDSRIKEILTVARGLLNDIQRSPYRDRIFVILDSVHTTGLANQLVQMGILSENIVTWPLNGIEYYYPPEILDNIFTAGGALEIKGDRITRNGLTYTKIELLDLVISQLIPTTLHHPEIETSFLTLLSQKIL